MFNQLLWWTAYKEQKNIARNENSKRLARRGKLPDISDPDLFPAQLQAIYNFCNTKAL